MLDLILDHVEPPKVEANKPFAMLSTLLDSDPYLGRCLVGRVEQGTAKVNDTVKAINLSGKQVESGRLTKLFKFEGTQRVPVNEAQTGDIICIAGLAQASVADTICNPDVNQPISSTPIDLSLIHISEPTRPY